MGIAKLPGIGIPSGPAAVWLSFLSGGFSKLTLVTRRCQWNWVKVFPQTFVGVNVIVTTKPFKVAPFLTDWVNYKQIKQAMFLPATKKIHCSYSKKIIFHTFFIKTENIAIPECRGLPFYSLNCFVRLLVGCVCVFVCVCLCVWRPPKCLP